jgi:hypothetical protein
MRLDGIEIKVTIGDEKVRAAKKALKPLRRRRATKEALFLRSGPPWWIGGLAAARSRRDPATAAEQWRQG